jgi:hypothetical protein
MAKTVGCIGAATASCLTVAGLLVYQQTLFDVSLQLNLDSASSHRMAGARFFESHIVLPPAACRDVPYT